MSAEDAELRLDVRISGWDWPLHLSIAPDGRDPETVAFGGAIYARGMYVSGTISAPSHFAGEVLWLSIIGFGTEVTFGADGLPEVGQLYRKPGGKRGDWHGVAALPKEALAQCAACLASVWTTLTLWVDDDPMDRGSISGVHFGGDQ